MIELVANKKSDIRTKVPNIFCNRVASNKKSHSKKIPQCNTKINNGRYKPDLYNAKDVATKSKKTAVIILYTSNLFPITSKLTIDL